MERNGKNNNNSDSTIHSATSLIADAIVDLKNVNLSWKTA